MNTGKIDVQRRATSIRDKALRRRFSRRVELALRQLPKGVQAYLDNVAVVVEAEPRAVHRESAQDDSDELFGLYHGIPRNARDGGYSMVVPDQITLFWGPLLRTFGSGSELDHQIRVTVLHELGHHLGFDELQLDEMGLA
ncbi:metallopeptidase family protein [soil metagenome]